MKIFSKSGKNGTKAISLIAHKTANGDRVSIEEISEGIEVQELRF